MIDNFNLIQNLRYRDLAENEYYVVQITRRKKDGVYPKHSDFVKYDNGYLFKSVEEILAKKQDIIAECEANGARAYMKANYFPCEDAENFTMEDFNHYTVMNYPSLEMTGIDLYNKDQDILDRIHQDFAGKIIVEAESPSGYNIIVPKDGQQIDDAYYREHGAHYGLKNAAFVIYKA